MNRNLRIYGPEAKRSHAQEAVVASVWTLLLILMVVGSILDRPSKPVETANAIPAESPPH